MKVYRELEIHGDVGTVKATLDGIKKAVGGTWMTIEDEGSLPGPPQHGFVCERTAEHPAATLWLVEKPGQLYVSNIVPSQGQPRLSEDEYNAIAFEFYERFVIPVADKTGVQVTLSDTNVTIEKWVSPGTAQLLRRFSIAANKSTGSSHPLDEERWCTEPFF